VSLLGFEPDIVKGRAFIFIASLEAKSSGGYHRL
jgi:hypothetical protein